MPDYDRLRTAIDAIRGALDVLSEEVESLGLQDATPSALPGPAAEASPYDLAKVIPPTRTEQPDSIVGGVSTTGFPDCCAVGGPGGYFCSGTLIAESLVVTAQHCKNVDRVFLRGHRVDQPTTGETILVAAQYCHPKLDLRVLVLEEASSVEPRHVAQGPEVQADRALLVGFGTIDFNGTVGYGRKRKVEVPIVSLACDDPGTYGCVEGSEVVAGHRGLSRDSCRGDSGGPLYIQSPEGGYYLLGATSRGAADAQRVCGDGGVYVRVDLTLDWIRDVTGITIEGPLL